MMNRCHLLIACLVAGLSACSADSQGISTNNWHPDTHRFDDLAKFHDPLLGDSAATLPHDVKRFYQLLRDKKWHETYELRAKAFRESVSESDYLAEAKQFGKSWGLVNYEVLSINFENSIPDTTNLDEAVLICKFTELPGPMDSYSTVYWHREEGVWRCLSAGPHNLPIFNGMRAPFVDWR